MLLDRTRQERATGAQKHRRQTLLAMAIEPCLVRMAVARALADDVCR
jgi:hypothetical protein